MMATSSLASDHPFAGGQLGLDGGAQQAVAGEPGEGAFFVEHLAGHERQAEQLPVRMRQATRPPRGRG